jgi:hypothetical protein
MMSSFSEIVMSSFFFAIRSFYVLLYAYHKLDTRLPTREGYDWDLKS